MNILDAIKSRRSIPIVKEEDVPKDLIEKVLEAGTYAPNHFRTEPWRYFVLTGNGRVKLGETFADITTSQLEDKETDSSKAKVERSKKNPLRAPVVIAVGVEPSDKHNVILKEEYAAVNSGVQNMLLAAHALGLGAMWRTGAICYHHKVRDFFGLSANGEIVAFVYLGFPDMEPRSIERTNYKDLTTWID